jgi:hypothetical protein
MKKRLIKITNQAPQACRIDLKFSPYGLGLCTEPFLKTEDPATSILAPAAVERGAV